MCVYMYIYIYIYKYVYTYRYIQSISVYIYIYSLNIHIYIYFAILTGVISELMVASQPVGHGLPITCNDHSVHWNPISKLSRHEKIWFCFFSAFFGISGSQLLCFLLVSFCSLFPASLLLCFSAFPCFSALHVLCFSAFLLSIFSAFPCFSFVSHTVNKPQEASYNT